MYMFECSLRYGIEQHRGIQASLREAQVLLAFRGVPFHCLDAGLHSGLPHTHRHVATAVIEIANQNKSYWSVENVGRLFSNAQ
jgi:hypothetical protein